MANDETILIAVRFADRNIKNSPRFQLPTGLWNDSGNTGGRAGGPGWRGGGLVP